MKVEAFRLELYRNEFHHKIEQLTYKHLNKYGIDLNFYFKDDPQQSSERTADIVDIHEFYFPWCHRLINSNKRVVVNVLESNPHEMNPWVERNLRLFNRIKDKVNFFVGKTEWNRQLLESLGIPREKTVYIPYAVDLDFFKPSPYKNWQIAGEDYSDQYIILFQSSFAQNKGCVELIDQFYRTCLGRNITLIMSGGAVSNQFGLVALSIVKYNLGKQVKIIPVSSIPFNRIPELLNLADLFVIPQGGLEPAQFSQPMLWAMSCGKPLISLNRGCATSMIESGVNGYRCNTYDEIGSWMSKLCSTEMDGERRNMGMASRAKAEREFSSEVTSKKYAELYEEVVK